MDFTHKVEGDVVVVTLCGKIMGGEDTAECRERMYQFIETDRKKFIMDMRDVEWTNSQGLGMLIGCYISVKRAGGNLVLARIANVKEILQVTRLDQVFDCYNSVIDAMRSLST